MTGLARRQEIDLHLHLELGRLHWDAGDFVGAVETWQDVLGSCRLCQRLRDIQSDALPSERATLYTPSDAAEAEELQAFAAKLAGWGLLMLSMPQAPDQGSPPEYAAGVSQPHAPPRLPLLLPVVEGMNTMKIPVMDDATLQSNRRRGFALLRQAYGENLSVPRLRAAVGGDITFQQLHVSPESLMWHTWSIWDEYCEDDRARRQVGNEQPEEEASPDDQP